LDRSSTASCLSTSCPNIDLIADEVKKILLLSCENKAANLELMPTGTGLSEHNNSQLVKYYLLVMISEE
jgi:hypothetical protein